MADSIRWAVRVTPVEELADENSGIHSIIHSDVGKSLGGSGTTTVATGLKYNGAKAIPNNSYVTIEAGTDTVETIYMKCVSNTGNILDGVIVSIDSGTTQHFKLTEGEAILIHPFGALGFGVTEGSIRVKSTGASVAAVIEYLFDAP